LKTLRLLVVTCVAFGALVGSAQAANLTLGGPLTGSTSNVGIGAPTTLVNLKTGTDSVISPVEGLVVGWNVLGAKSGSFALRVLTPGPSTTFTGSGRGGAITPATTGLEHFDAALPIKAGQTIGLDSNTAGAEIGIIAPGEIAEDDGGVLGEGSSAAFDPASGFQIAFNAEVQPAPTIASLGATAGPLAGGTGVLIMGNDLEGATSVRFGGVPAVFGQISETAILATSPPGPAAIGVPISVSTRAGTGTSAQLFTYQGPPTVPPEALAPAKCVVPNLKGKKLKVAKTQLRAHHCGVGTVTKAKGATTKDGKVVKQNPKPGASRAANSKVAVKLG
jgi:hypothetical protein